MKLLNNTKVLLILILLLAAVLRFPLLGQLPAGLTIDEAGQGYSAYSILKTGKDEWGDFLPLNPRGFGDYKPPVFMYLLIPSIAFFGLSEFAVRLPSAIAGILTVWIMFFLVRGLFKNTSLGLVASFLLAISPWHVYYSRLGWESNVGLLFFSLGIWLFLKGIEAHKWLIFSVISFGFSTLSYHSFKLLVPLMVLGLIAIYRKEFLKIDKKELVFSGAIVLIFVLILGFGFVFSGAGRRASDQSIFKEENLGELRKKQYDDKFPQPLPRILNNKYKFYLSKITDNYIGYYSLPFLFGPHRSDGTVLNFPSQGLLYIWLLPFIFLGIFILIKNRNKSSAVIFLWLFSAPIPAALTQDYMHAGRAQTLFLVLTLISVVGLNYVWQITRRAKYKRLMLYCAIGAVVISLISRTDNYLFHTFNRPHGGLVQGYKDIIQYIKLNQDKYDKVIFTKSNSEPQAFIAFYTKWDPKDFQSQSKNWRDFEDKGFRYLDMTDFSLGKYEFRKVDLSRDRHESNALIIGTAEEVPLSITPSVEIKDATGKTVFVGVYSNEIPE